MTGLSKFLRSASTVFLLSVTIYAAAQTPPAKPQSAKANAAVMKECVDREQVNSNAGKEAATLACREQREAEKLKELGPHSSSEVTVNSPGSPAGKMSASGHSSHSGNSGTEPSNIIQESKNTVIDKPY